MEIIGNVNIMHMEKCVDIPDTSHLGRCKLGILGQFLPLFLLHFLLNNIATSLNLLGQRGALNYKELPTFPYKTCYLKHCF